METLGATIGRYITINANITNTMNGRVISRELKKINAILNDEDILKHKFTGQESIEERLNLLKAEGVAQAENLEMAQRRALAELESQTGVEELGKNYKSLSQSLKNSTKHSTEWN